MFSWVGVAELYRVHYRELLEFFRHRFSDREGCEDLCQEVSDLLYALAFLVAVIASPMTFEQ
jgi:hypothetical protein